MGKKWFYPQETHHPSPYFRQEANHVYSDFLTSAIKWCFYILFFALPLIMYPTTFELYEFNKMWFVFGMSLIIFFLWTSKIIADRKFYLKKTPLDIPILLFLLSQFISTVVSLDPHVSFWGYYSRFNGGFLSTLTYIFLYYAFASNLIKSSDDESQNQGLKSKLSYKVLLITIISGTAVALWGFPSHFGYDPTCAVFRYDPNIPFFNNFNVSCWTESFHPTVRMFSTLGQPNWLAAHLAVLIPLAIAFIIGNSKREIRNAKQYQNPNDKNLKHFEHLNLFRISIFGFITLLFYIDLLWTASQSGFAGLWVGLALFFILTCVFVFRIYKHSIFRVLSFQIVFLSILALVAITFFVGTPIGKITEYTFPSLSRKYLSPPKITNQPKIQPPAEKQAPPPGVPVLESGGTESGKIRKIVWAGALKIWQEYPLFGSGVETFAYTYYKVRPVEHNLTSEWDFLYNKAHNEYLNYLSTTGTFGLGTYLLLIAWFFYTSIKYIASSSKEKKYNISIIILATSLIGSYASILVSNFFGFSVVTVNLFLFIIPIFFYDLVAPQSLKGLTFSFGKSASSQTTFKNASEEGIGPGAMLTMLVLALIVGYFEILLFLFWQADKKYALGNNLDKAQHYVEAEQYLRDAVSLRSGEDTFKDELSINLSTLAIAYAEHGEKTRAVDYLSQAKALSDEVVLNHPNNVVFYKTRTRILFTLAQLDKRYMKDTIDTINTAHTLAPTDAKIRYNQALIYDQAGKHDEALDLMEDSVKLKPNYRDAQYGLALLCIERSKSFQKSDPERAQVLKEKAIKALETDLYISPNDTQAKELLKTLK